ncbi:MAG: hypothetical protein AAGG68_28695 [Bacteroidota bacterium]
MLGLLIIYFLGKRFYTLAEEHDKSAWGFAILGVGIYYAASIVAGIIIVILYELYGTGSIDDVNDRVLSLISMPFGILAWWLAYLYTKKRFEAKPKTVTDSNLLDDSFID